MDEMISQAENMTGQEKREGFPGQRLRVLPPAVVRMARNQQPTAGLLVTDAGYFPAAAHHARRRHHGTSATVLILCTNGAGKLLLAGNSHEVHPGELAMVPADTAHEYRADLHDPWTIWWLHVKGDDVAALVSASRFTLERPVWHVDNVPLVASLIDEALIHLETDDSLTRLLAASGAARHLFSLLPILAHEGPDRPDVVSAAKDFVTKRLPERSSVASIAAHVNLSPSHLNRLFREEMGYGLLEYQSRLRLASAAELLHTSELPIAAIARTVGYADTFYFSRHFKRFYGVSPSQYRGATMGTV